MNETFKQLVKTAKEGLLAIDPESIPIDDFNEYDAVCVIVAGVIISSGNAFHLVSWRETLKKIGFDTRKIKLCENKLRDERWLTAPKKSKIWLTLSEVGWKFYGLVQPHLDINLYKKVEEIYIQCEDIYKAKTSDLATNINYSLAKEKTQNKGTDLLLYISKGDSQRVLWAAGKLRNLRGRPYGYVLACCPPEEYKPDDVVKKLKQKSKWISRLGIKVFHSEWWKKDYDAILEVVDEPRGHLDIIANGFPRHALFGLDIALRHKPYSYSMYYTKAPYYPNINAHVVSKPVSWKGKQTLLRTGTETVAAFGEVNAHRFRTNFIRSVASSKTMVYLFLPRNITDYSTAVEKTLDKQVRKETERLWSSTEAKIVEVEVDYTSVNEILNKLRYYQPHIIYAGGSRSVILGITEYVYECLQFDKPPPEVTFTHIESELYARGVIEKIFPISGPMNLSQSLSFEVA